MKGTKSIIATLLLCLVCVAVRAQDVALETKGGAADYVETILKRSVKIVDALSIEDRSIRDNVVNTVANRYFELNAIYAERDSLEAALNASSIGKEEPNQAQRAINDRKDAALYRTHAAYIAKLSLWIDDKTIEAVKDGMTYGVVGVTYNSYLDMIPTLNDRQRKRIMVWLVEAREMAMDAESSNKKHETFGRYKGKINNYLSAAGYDLGKEREEWNKRIAARKKSD